MTPKEKAIQIINTYKIANYPKLDIDECKKCALIEVDELQQAFMYLDADREEFWFEVKQEIESYES